MKRIKLSSNLYLDEVIDPHTYLNSPDHGQSLVPSWLVDAFQLVRYHYMKPLTINNWWDFYQKNKENITIDQIIRKIEASNSIRKWSGVRTLRCSIGSKTSEHKIKKGKFRALDLKGDEKELFNIIKNNAKEFYHLGVRRVETTTITPGWLHMDGGTRNPYKNAIKVIDRRKTVELLKW